MNLSIDRTTLSAIIIPMAALLFVGFISYENTIQFVQILRTKAKDSMFTDSLNIIIRNAIRLQRLTEDILDVQKIESNTLQLKKVRIDLNALISELVADCRKLLLNEKKESIRLLTELNFSKPIILYADRDRYIWVCLMRCDPFLMSR